jgi:hypothetical protein
LVVENGEGEIVANERAKAEESVLELGYAGSVGGKEKPIVDDFVSFPFGAIGDVAPELWFWSAPSETM